MAKQKGSDFLLKLDTTGAGNYTTIGGGQQSRFTIKRDLVDTTNQGSPSKHREALEGASIAEFSASLSGTLDSAAPMPTLESVVRAGTIRNWQIVLPGLGTYTGAFQVTQMQLEGEHSKDMRFDISLENAGLVSFA